MLSLVGVKVIAMVFTGLVPAMFGTIPWKIGKHVNQASLRNKITISCFLCFGAGILMGLSLLHLLSEVNQITHLGFELIVGLEQV